MCAGEELSQELRAEESVGARVARRGDAVECRTAGGRAGHLYEGGRWTRERAKGGAVDQGAAVTAE